MRKYVAELIGTFMLVFVGTGAVVIAKGDTLTIALAFGLTVTVMAYAFGAISGGHFNPAVSIAMMINQRLSVKDGIAYIVAQFIGSALASGLMAILINALSLSKTGFGQTDFPKIGGGVAFLVETVVTFAFILVILMVTSNRYGNSQMAPLAIGVTLSLLIIVALNLTGASLNPARSFGPAVFAGGAALTHYWLYVAAPVVGAILAALAGQLFGSEEN
ncbi:MIP/aquaporin family protein [Latilactobacillus fuchuensis]|uniref:Aquaporin Z n=2 Tax=Latilactobacillus fuchuensis TaxID=164393 RepID=A0A2N9DY07_9LACO|nr:aquaporin [Latilactobacillus fuchuensis]KRL58585.1 aqpZ protein [Latilactobacillus fuchuensis DSM 14340 = JCM 11249]MCP8857406.1 aquaporin [Latilactobacillus fuchuensis]SPC39766.1 Aquaporin Z [Latilactobacillus fuchuensis]